jgi:acyl carrier protein
MAAPAYTPDEIRKHVREMVADIADVPPDEIGDTTKFGDDLGLDSLRAMELMVAVDRKYRIKIPEEEFTHIQNVDQAVAAVQRHLR